MSKNPDAIDPEEAAKVARDIKSVLSQKEKVIFYRNLQFATLSHCIQMWDSGNFLIRVIASSPSSRIVFLFLI